ncbi:MAG: hypothetical protein ACPG1C_10220 [Alphaproteobacteria bacterium]
MRKKSAKISAFMMAAAIFLAMPFAAFAESENAERTPVSERKTEVKLLRADGSSSPPPAIQRTNSSTQQVINPFDPGDLRDFVNKIRERRRAPDAPDGNQCRADQVDSTDGCICPLGEEEFNGACVEECSAGFERNEDGVCVPEEAEPVCGFGQVQQGNSCVCDADGGFEEFDGLCVPECGVGQRRNENTGVCEADVPDLVCGANEEPQGNECVCAAGFEDFNGECVAECAGGQIRNDDGICEGLAPACGPNEEFNGEFCTCAAGFEDFNGGCVAECVGGQVRNDDGICEVLAPACGPNEEFNGEFCTCAAGFEDFEGECVAACRADQVRIGDTCQCPPGEVELFGACQVPGANQQNACNDQFSQQCADFCAAVGDIDGTCFCVNNPQHPNCN